MALLFRRIRDKERHMLTTMGISLIEHGHVTTTTTKAKALRPIVERWITAGRKAARANGAAKLALHRLLVAELRNASAVRILIDNVVSRVGDRAGGYTRLYKIGMRKGDAAETSMITFVDPPKTDDDKPAKTKAVDRTAGSTAPAPKKAAPAKAAA